MDRRQFIKATALTGTSATLASCGNPEYHLIRFIPEEVLTPGIAVLKPSVCPLCSAGCGLSVREAVAQNPTGSRLCAANASYHLGVLHARLTNEPAALEIFHTLVEKNEVTIGESGLPLAPLARLKLLELNA